MRDIKFKCWVKDVRQFAEVRHIHFYKGKKLVKVYDQPIEEEVWLGSEDVELLQYTGLKDKNGVEIYEGDILQAPDLFNGVIEYHPTRAQFIGRNVGKSHQGEDFDTLYTSDGTFKHSKVIGNIYESPELLTGGNQQCNKHADNG